MFIDESNPVIRLLKILGCDLTAIFEISTWKEMCILGFEFLFACFILYWFFKMFYNLMIRFMSGKWV